jgi:hypothetical protein
METGTRTHLVPTPNTEYIKYEVDARRCHLKVTDAVTPETVVGWHYQSGEPVHAGFHGHVATIYFNPMHDSMMVMIAITRSERASRPAVLSGHKLEDDVVMCPQY